MTISWAVHHGCDAARTILPLVKVVSDFNPYAVFDYDFQLGNTPIGSPCGSPTLGRKQLTSIGGSGETDQVLRAPRGPPDNATKGFQYDILTF